MIRELSLAQLAQSDLGLETAVLCRIDVDLSREEVRHAN